MTRSINYIGIFVSFLFLFSCAKQNLESIVDFQTKLSEEWNNPQTTPLKEEEKADFKGITYFPIHKKYSVAADFQPIKNGKTLPFPTSAKKIKYYKEYGKAHFKLNGKQLELTLYQSDPPIEGYENSLFIPFKDQTNGDSSYGGGRYIDVEISDIQGNKLVIDFNKAYNPYCAYSSHYNCPIPPANNFLETEIKAGVSYLQ